MSITAKSDVSNTASALPSDGGGDGTKVGIGASVAFNYAENTTAASIGDNAELSGAHNLSLNAQSAHQMTTEAKNGAKGSTAVTPVVAISISDNETDATLGGGDGISITGDFSAQAALKSKVETTATGDTESDSTGVGISIAVTVVNDNSLATTGRDLSAGGAMTFSASTISGSSSSATASVAGGEPDDGNSGNSSGTGDQSVTNKTSDQMSFADSKSKEKNSSAKGTQGASAPSIVHLRRPGERRWRGRCQRRTRFSAGLHSCRADDHTPAACSQSSVGGQRRRFGDRRRQRGVGRDRIRSDHRGVVDTTNNTINLGGAHGLKTGDKVHYLAGQ